MNQGRHFLRLSARPGVRSRLRDRAFTLLHAAFLLLALALGTARAGPMPEASGLRFGENGKLTRIVIDFDRKVKFAASVLTEPDRLAIDFETVDWQLGQGAGQPPRGLALGYAVDTGPAGARMTVRLARPARIASDILLPPSRDSSFHRLVIDVVADPPSADIDTPMADVPRAAEAAVPARSSVPVPATRPVTLAALPSVGAAVNGHARKETARRDKPVIVLDPGHGGIDPGAMSADGLKEKDLVLEMARELRTLIEQSGRYRVELTRDGDEFIRLRDRIGKARQLGGQVFISLHADSLRMTELRGASIYTLSEQASDEEAAKFAALENKADVLSGADLSQHDAVVATILIDLAQRDTNNKSIAFADILAEELAGVTSLVKRHRRFAGFAVLKAPDVPSVLLELGYLSNPDDARNLAQPDYRAKLGLAIVRALDQYFAVPRT
jgi:N-acetylmuramoyl-L-alanine amidase